MRSLELKPVFLIVLDKLGEQFETIAIGSARCGIVDRQPTYLGKESSVIVVGPDDFRFKHHRAQFIRFVYSAWVPAHFTNTTPALNATCTSNR